ncbi:MAG: HRDC domain-containing protein [Truepera sp.]|nr:HRDC domain-containing protein [Truepera sp.]
MDNNRLLGYTLIAIGVLALLAVLGAGPSWLWVAIAGAGFLFAYSRQRHYGLLVVGGLLAGAALGILLTVTWSWRISAFLLSLAAGFLLVDRVEPKAVRWPLYSAAVLAAFGLLVWLFERNILTSWWFALLLIVAGAALLLRGRSESGWVSVSPPASPSPPAATVPSAPKHVVEPTAPHTQHAPPGDQVVTITPPEEAVAEPELPLTSEQQARLERLTAWRKATAARDGVSAYVVLPNATLSELARANPSSLDELAKIKGIGPVKLERYGSELLAVLAGTATS